MAHGAEARGAGEGAISDVPGRPTAARETQHQVRTNQISRLDGSTDWYSWRSLCLEIQQDTNHMFF